MAEPRDYIPESFDYPILFTHRGEKRLSRSRRVNKRIFEELKAIGAVDESGKPTPLAKTGLPGAGVFGRITNQLLTQENLSSRLRSAIFPRLSSSLPLPPGYGEENIAALSRNLARKLSPEISKRIIDRYSVTSADLPFEDRLEIAKEEARTGTEEYLSSEKTQKTIEKTVEDYFEKSGEQRLAEREKKIQEEGRELTLEDLRDEDLLDPLALSDENLKALKDTAREMATQAARGTIEQAQRFPT